MTISCTQRVCICLQHDTTFPVSTTQARPMSSEESDSYPSLAARSVTAHQALARRLHRSRQRKGFETRGTLEAISKG